jgi:hypothetical protein
MNTHKDLHIQQLYNMTDLLLFNVPATVDRVSFKGRVQGVKFILKIPLGRNLQNKKP